jgi:hypothetical protein
MGEDANMSDFQARARNRRDLAVPDQKQKQEQEQNQEQGQEQEQEQDSLASWSGARLNAQVEPSFGHEPEHPLRRPPLSRGCSQSGESIARTTSWSIFWRNYRGLFHRLQPIDREPRLD